MSLGGAGFARGMSRRCWPAHFYVIKSTLKHLKLAFLPPKYIVVAQMACNNSASNVTHHRIAKWRR